MYRYLREFTEKRGEPIIGEFDPTTFEGELASVGWTLREQLDHDAQHDRYFRGRDDDECPMPGSYLVHAAVTGNGRGA